MIYSLGELPVYAESGSWSMGFTSTLGNYYVGNALAAAFRVPLPKVHNGAVLSSVSVWLKPAIGHASLPATTDRIAIQVSRDGGWTNNATAPVGVTLSATTTQYLTMPATTAEYDTNVFKLTYTCDQNNTIDNATYLYRILVREETGASGVYGTKFYAVELNFSTITDMRFP